MNYLAHALMTPPGDAMLLAGHVLGDYFKGRPSESFPQGLRKAIWLHRQVDAFSDSHPAHKRIREVLQNTGRFRGIFTDVLVDHLLVSDTRLFPFRSDFLRFIQSLRQVLRVLEPYVPPARRNHFLHICARGWLEAYRDEEQFREIIRRLCGRFGINKDQKAYGDLILQSTEECRELAWSLFTEGREFVNHLLFKDF